MEGRNASIIRRFHPRYQSPKAIYQRLLDQLVDNSTVWLDMGCGKRLCGDDALNAELPRRALLTIGCDRDPYLSKHTSIRDLVICDAAALPFRDGTFNLVTSSMVFEHLQDPDQVFKEVARISKPGGRFVVFTPNRFNYAMVVAALTPYRFHLLVKKLTYYFARRQWRDFEEELFPTFYRANSRQALAAISARSAFRVQQLQYLAMAHSFGFVKPLYAVSLLFERVIDTLGLHGLKADLLAVFVREGTAPVNSEAEALDQPAAAAAAGGR